MYFVNCWIYNFINSKFYLFSGCDGRVVKAFDSKSNGVSPRRFESCSQRRDFKAPASCAMTVNHRNLQSSSRNTCTCHICIENISQHHTQIVCMLSTYLCCLYTLCSFDDTSQNQMILPTQQAPNILEKTRKRSSSHYAGLTWFACGELWTTFWCNIRCTSSTALPTSSLGRLAKVEFGFSIWGSNPAHAICLEQKSNFWWAWCNKCCIFEM